LIRYLASKGLYKDADGIAALSDDDVRAIEAGMTTAHEHSRTGISKRLNRIFFEYANYKAGGTPNGHSVFQRLEFWRAALHIIGENPWAGVGTGDTKIAFASAYEKMNSSLDPQFQLRAHNQYLTMWLTYGIAGLLLFLSVLLAGWKKPGNRRPLLRVFIIICAMSFLSEDTLESQAGVMFFVMFLLLFSLKRELTLSELRPV
jgi:O-antigen ligase